MQEAEAMNLLIEDQYTVEDVRNQRQISSFVQSVVRHSNDAGLSTVLQQLNWAWNHLHPGLQRDIDRPNASTTIVRFIQQLEDNQSA